jgi:hypothetical protein
MKETGINWAEMVRLPKPLRQRLTTLISYLVETPWGGDKGRDALLLTELANTEDSERALGFATTRLIRDDPGLLNRASLRAVAQLVRTQKLREAFIARLVDDLVNADLERVELASAALEPGFACRIGESVDAHLDSDVEDCLRQAVCAHLMGTQLFYRDDIDAIASMRGDDLRLLDYYGGFVLPDGFLPTPNADHTMLLDLGRLQNLGLVTGLGGAVSLGGVISSEQSLEIDFGRDRLQVSGPVGQAWAVSGCIATERFRQLIRMRSLEPSRSCFTSLAEFFLAQSWVSRVARADYTVIGGEVSMDIVEVFEPAPSSAGFPAAHNR